MSSTNPTRYVLTISEDQYEPAYASWLMMADENDGRTDLYDNGSIKVDDDMPTDRDGWLALVERLQPAGTRLLTAEPCGYGWEAGARITWVTA